LAAFTAALAAQTASDPALLGRIREHMRQRLSDVPNYTCQETVERAERGAHQPEYHVRDTMQLEVAQVSGRELLAFPGGRFEAKPPSTFASSGLMVNGVFAMQARGLFFGDRATWKSAGERTEDGRTLVRFDFAVPQAKSGYVVGNGRSRAMIPYHGFLLADPRTLDAVRIEIFSDKIAKDIGMERADMVIEYQNVRIGTADALLPGSAEVITLLRGSKTRQRNRILFSRCRQYGADSAISYADAAPVEPASPLLLVLRLAAPLDCARIESGAEVQSTVDEDVVSGIRLLVPKGATVSGRVSRVERRGPDVEIGLELKRAEWDGGSADIVAELKQPEHLIVTAASCRLPAGFRTTWTVRLQNGSTK